MPTLSPAEATREKSVAAAVKAFIASPRDITDEAALFRALLAAGDSRAMATHTVTGVYERLRAIGQGKRLLPHQVRVEALAKPEHVGDWHDKPLRYQVLGPADECQKFCTRREANSYRSIRRTSFNQLEAGRRWQLVP